MAEMCKAEFTTDDAVKGDKESNWLIENAVMQIRGIIRTIKCHIESNAHESNSAMNRFFCRGCWSMQGCILPRCQKGRDGKTPFGRLHGKRPTQEFVPFGEKVLAKQVSTDPIIRMNPEY